MSRQVEALESEEASPRVLLVDDDAETLALLRAFLEDEGIRVVGTAGDGSEVLEQADRLRPDVVLMDLRMPEGRRVQRHAADQGAPTLHAGDHPDVP